MCLHEMSIEFTLTSSAIKLLQLVYALRIKLYLAVSIRSQPAPMKLFLNICSVLQTPA